MRRALALLILCGCDAAFGLDGRDARVVDVPIDQVLTGDSDGDGALDGVDLCPHLPNEREIDSDGDGIGVDCDPDDTVASSRRFFPFDAGVPTELASTGVIQEGSGTIDLGTLDQGLSTLVLDTAAGHVDLAIGFEVLGTDLEGPTPSAPWCELGLFAVHRAFTPDNTQRGDNCFYGVSDIGSENTDLYAYLEFHEDEATPVMIKFPPPVVGTRGRMAMRRSPARVDCTVEREGSTVTNGFDVVTLGGTLGSVAISTDRLTARLDYVWVAYH